MSLTEVLTGLGFGLLTFTVDPEPTSEPQPPYYPTSIDDPSRIPKEGWSP